LTLSTSAACSAIERFLWITPRPPSRASAMASSDSVTVSMAALTIGMLSVMWRENSDAVWTSRGCTSENPGTSSTSSKVSAAAPTFPGGAFESGVATVAPVAAAAYGRGARSSGRNPRFGLFRGRARRREVVGGAEAHVDREQEAVEPGRELVGVLREDPVPA